MKRKTILATILILALLAPAWAEASPERGPTSFSLGFHLGYWDAKDVDKYDLNNLFGFGMIGQYRPHTHWGVDLRLGGYATEKTRDVFMLEQGWYEHKSTLVVLPLECGLLGFLPLGDTVELYGGPGAGFYLFDGEYVIKQGPQKTTYDLSMDDKFAPFVRIGGRVKLTYNLALFAEGQYTWVKSKFIDFEGDTIRLDFSGPSVLFGMLFSF